MTLRRGLTLPFQRDKKRDFAHATGVPLVVSRIKQALLTRVGELAWDTTYGSRLRALLHAPCDATTQALARTCVSATFAQSLPDLRLLEVRVTADSARLRLAITCSDPDGTSHYIPLVIGDPFATPPTQL